MNTLALKGGDLVIGRSGYRTVTGAAKVRQDLGQALAEGYGSDAYHPRWGSLLDTFVGDWLDTAQNFLIEQEVARVVQNYIAVQAARIAASGLASERSGLTTADVVRDIQDIVVAQDPWQPDRITVRVSVMTTAAQTVEVTAGVGG